GLDPHPELDARIGRPWLDTQADGGLERVGFAVEDLNGLAEADRTLDTDARSFAERDVDAELSRQGRLDDLLLNHAIERNGDLAAGVVHPDVYQRVLLGQPRQGGSQRALITRAHSGDGGFHRRRREVIPGRCRGWLTDRVADPGLVQAPEPADLTGDEFRSPDPPATVSDADGCRLRLGSAAVGGLDVQPLTAAHRAGVHPDVCA